MHNVFVPAQLTSIQPNKQAVNALAPTCVPLDVTRGQVP